MEEKERYVIRYDLDYNRCLIDTEKNQGVGDYIQIVKLLNQQDKQIKGLIKGTYKICCETCCAFDEQVAIARDNYNECEQLKQQLHDLSKKIVEEIRDDMSKRIMGKQIKWGDNIQIGFICNAINECLDTILKNNM